MSFRINTNANAMSALRNLSMTGTEMSKSINRLSTGLRINSGADDPSGLIASESYRAQISGIDQALQNSQSAMSYAKTAEGGLDEVNRLLRDARSLAVANGNSTLDATQKQANQTQLNNIMQSVTRIAQNTKFGTRNLLDGSAGVNAGSTHANFSKVSFNGNFGGSALSANSAVSVNVTTAATQGVATGTKAIATAATLVGAGNFSINGAAFETTASTTRTDLVNMINAETTTTGVTATVNGSNMVVLTASGFGTDSKVQLIDTNGLMLSAAGALNGAGVNAVADVTIGSTVVTFNKGKGLDFKDADGNAFTLASAGNSTGNVANALQVNVGATSFQIGGNAGQTASLAIGNFTAASLSVNNLDITGTNMKTSLDAIDAAINTVSQARGNIGSFMKNTLESNVRSLGVARENMSATDSALREIDVAQEMTNYTKLQILSQSGLSMLAQANQSPQSVLSLLR
ncbi:MAG: flagellin [Fimbriimonadaceae bacterium]|jgi:flagellin|nr:flagellin [Fimbriimonadaceae bacterium]